MKLYSTMAVIFLVPIVMASKNGGGCSSAPEPGPLTTTQVEQVLIGNTVSTGNNKSFALVRKDGTLAGRNIPNGGTTGTWRLSDNGVVCAKWKTAKGDKENCDALRFAGGNDYQWGGNSLKIFKGNPQKL